MFGEKSHKFAKIRINRQQIFGFLNFEFFGIKIWLRPQHVASAGNRAASRMWQRAGCGRKRPNGWLYSSESIIVSSANTAIVAKTCVEALTTWLVWCLHSAGAVLINISPIAAHNTTGFVNHASTILYRGTNLCLQKYWFFWPSLSKVRICFPVRKQIKSILCCDERMGANQNVVLIL